MDENRSASRSTLNVTIPSSQSVNKMGHQSSKYEGSQKMSAHSSQIRHTERELKQVLAVRAIERCWCSYRDKQMFKLLKHAICAAEHSLTFEILRKVCPTEAQLLKDPGIKTRVRFRFSGSEFPPVILFKIFTHTEGTGLKYLSGKRCIKPATNAASDACRMMGHRKFYDQMIADTCQHMQDRITDEVDVTTVKDYMQYISNLDEMPAHIGGRDNLWRKLDLNALPRTTILYDIVDYLHRGTPSSRLRAEIPALTARPITQEIQLNHIRIISRLRAPAVNVNNSLDIHTARNVKPQHDPSQTSRRSRQAKQKVAKMRKLYMTSGMGGDTQPTPSLTNHAADMNDFTGNPGIADKDFDKWEDDAGEEDWEKEADQLYAWTKGLSYDDIDLTSPC
ncbi:uncharacterized protein CXorf58-like [Amphiura filiformis]|uniref:uncharacterized protein CXorf58-like n=1 Tax=Amphiura filiformis TaxID=82378 RepID=UPI003B218755